MSTQYIPTITYNRIRVVLTWIAAISMVTSTIGLIIDGTMAQYPLAGIIICYILYIVLTAITIVQLAAVLYILINGFIAVLNTIVNVIVFFVYPFYVVYRFIAAIERKFS